MVAFVFLAVLILASAVRVITVPRVVHAALYLALCFVGVAGVFLLLGADFLAATQVLIYVGGVTTLIIFAIMLSAPTEVRGGTAEAGQASAASRAGEIWVAVLAALGAAGFAAVMGMLYQRAGFSAQAAPLGHTTARLGAEIFTAYALPFEVASLILLAALVGAIYLSVRIPPGTGGGTR
jgi:NADH:ubiquinone oxidoreductase subunit 6 (subunit J)